MKQLFASISAKIAKPSQGFFESHIDQTITVENLVNFLIKQGLLHNVCRPWRDENSYLLGNDTNQTMSAHENHETSQHQNTSQSQAPAHQTSHNQSNTAPSAAADAHELTPEELE